MAKFTPYGQDWYTHAKPTISKWKRHFENKTHLIAIGFTSYKCDKCEFSASTKVKLEEHKNIHRICEVCGRGPFNRPARLKSHMEIHKRNVS